ncbi:MAG: baseplate J/gp47 family protein [Chloroflexota bacterium]
MAGGIIYLEVDDEITSVASRVRGASEPRVAVVLPYGSRVATSRINFRLLARDALTHERRLSIVAGDPATRALAASAGLPVFATVNEYEASLADQPSSAGAASMVALSTAPAAVGGGDTIADVAPVATATVAPAPTVAPRPTVEPAPTVEPEPEPEPVPGDPSDATIAIDATGLAAAEPRSWPARLARPTILIALALIALLALAGGVGAFVLLPSASVIITPREEAVGPIQFDIVADPSATNPDPTNGIVPAQRLTADLSASDTFQATGKRVEQSAATGRVRFTSLNTAAANTIPAGSIVSTEGGIAFRTANAVTIPRATIVPPLSVQPGAASVDVTAVKAGSGGNVPANSITVVPRTEDPTITKVRNLEPTTGGSREEFKKVQQSDVDAALATLRSRLETEFEAKLAEPAFAPPGTTVFPDSAEVGEPAPTTDPQAFVGQELDSFDLGVHSTGSVIAVDETPIQGLAADRLAGSVAAGHQLVDGSTAVDVGAARVDGQRVAFPATASARQVVTVDPALVRAAIRGRSIDDARAALARFGDVKLSVWPDWVTSITTVDPRVDVTIRHPVAVETPPPSGSTGP